jgi:signal peptidase
MERLASSTTRLARVLGNLALVAVTLACAVYLGPTLFGYERYVITGGSMSGSIERGSIAFEKPTPVADLAVGDVITYLPPADSGVPHLVTHRVVQMHDGAHGATVLRTKGDANDSVDPWSFSLTARTQPVEKFSVPVLGYAFIALADRETRMLAIGVPAALIALLSLVELGTTLTRSAGTPRRPEEPVAPVGAVARPGAVSTP